jgi:hypothetical protein
MKFLVSTYFFQNAFRYNISEIKDLWGTKRALRLVTDYIIFQR